MISESLPSAGVPCCGWRGRMPVSGEWGQRQGGPLLPVPSRQPPSVLPEAWESPDGHWEEPAGGGGVLADCPALIAGPTSPPWTTPSAVWGSSSTCRRRRRRRTPGCRPGGSTTSSGRTSWWICTSRCEGGARVHTPPPVLAPPSPDRRGHLLPPTPTARRLPQQSRTPGPEACAALRAHHCVGTQQVLNKCADDVFA